CEPMRSTAEKQQKARLVRVRKDLLEEVLSTIHHLKANGLGLPLAYVLSHVIPGSEKMGMILILRDPNTGKTIAHISALDDTAVVDPRYDVTEEDIDNLLREILNAVYTVIVTYHNYLSRVLSEQNDQKWLERGKVKRKFLLDASERLLRYSPIILPEISRMVEELLDKVGVWDVVYVVYEVKAPRELIEYVVHGNVHPEASLKTGDEEIYVRVDNVSSKTNSMELRFKSGVVAGYRLPALETSVVAELLGLKCTETACNAKIGVILDWYCNSLLGDMLVPADPGIVEKHVSMGIRWRETASKVIEQMLMSLEQELASLTSGVFERKRKLKTDKTETATAIKALKFWLTLAKYGEWNVISVEPLI
ncbi:MAG: hypothetical protein QXE92_03225, partial [Thermofilaceae archaeon]